MTVAAKRKLNFGVIGLGWPGLMHSQAILSTPSAALHAVADTNVERLDAFLAQHPVKNPFADYRKMLSDPKIDAVIVCLPNFLHYSVSLEALRAGKHVLCEKPPTLTSPEMRKLKIEAETRGLIYAFGRQMRFEGKMVAARKLIQSGKLGEIYCGKTSWLRKRGIPVGIGGWFLDKSRSGGGALIDIGIHALDNAWFLMGSPKPAAVSARVFQTFGELVPSNLKNDVDDSGFAFIKFETGQVITLETTWAANLPESMAEGWNGTSNCLLFGSKASLQLAPLRLFVGNGEHIEEELIASEETDQFGLQIANFVRAIRTGTPPLSDASHALWLMQMLDAIYRSSATGREVRI